MKKKKKRNVEIALEYTHAVDEAMCIVLKTILRVIINILRSISRQLYFLISAAYTQTHINRLFLLEK